jgi:hypothetical protein
MLKKTGYYVDINKLQSQFNSIGKFSINLPTGDRFYDPWVIKEEFKNTVWEEIISVFKFPIGEARIIVLEKGTCYQRHADIDDRYHLNISGNHSYLCDLHNIKMYELVKDGYWYKMDASLPHTAINAGSLDRAQLVVRELLTNNNLEDPAKVSIKGSGYNLRYIFDGTFSPWLNQANKKGIINNFSHDEKSATFNVEKGYVNNLQDMLPTGFTLEIL